jgi:hypothetical protein
MPARITLLVPFIAPPAFTEEALERAAGVIQQSSPLRVELRRPAFFLDGITVLYLPPEPPEPFVALTEALVAAFPEHPPYSRQYDEIVPQLTVATRAEEAILEQGRGGRRSAAAHRCAGRGGMAHVP